MAEETSAFTLETLASIVEERASADPADSYTARLKARGIEKCAQKLGEEAVEAAIAAVTHNRAELTKEAADLLYHLLVVLHVADVPLHKVLTELQNRTAQTGLQEKASRPKA